jgi:competence protein ComEC
MPLFWLSLAFLLGVILSSWVSLPVWAWLVLAGACASLIFFPWLFRFLTTRAPKVIRFVLNLLPLRVSQEFVRFMTAPPLPGALAPSFLIPLALCMLCLGGARYRAVQPEITPENIAWYNGGESRLVVVGVVAQPPDVYDNYIQLRVQAEQVRPEESILHTEVSGLILARVFSDGDWHYGDRVVLRGELQTPPEGEEFSYRDYLARQGVYSYMRYPQTALLEPGQGDPFHTAIYAFKEKALGLVYRFFPDPQASLLAGILLGVETGIDENVDRAFRDTGTTHIIAISGFNITIVAGLFSTLFGRLFGRVRGAVAAAVAIGVYTILVGADPPVVRAAIMGGFSLLARQIGRRQHGLNGLAITAGLMTFFNPLLPWDVGFQLSFMATLGLVLYAQPFMDAFVRLASRRLPEAAVSRLAGPVGEYFLFTLAAQLTTLPIIVYHFRRLSLSSLPANLAILPAQPPIMVVGGLAVLLGFIFFPLGQWVAYLVWPFVAYTIRVVEWFAGFSGGVFVLGEVSWVLVLLFYLVLFSFTFWGKTLRDKLPALRPAFLFSGLFVVTSLAWSAALSAPDGILHVTLLDVGTGDGILIQTPGGRYVLVDGGPSATRLSDSLGRRLPLFHRRLDVLVVASTREENVAALPRVVERFPPGQVLWAGPPNLSYASRSLGEALAELQVPIVTAEAGHVLDLGEGAELEVLTVGKRGAVLLLTWENFRMLLPIGVDFEGMENLEMGEAIGPVTALLLADSGYAPLNPPEWIENLNPQLVLLSVSVGDYDGLPSPETLDALEGYTFLRTDKNGWVQLATDGENFWVAVERE